MYQTGSATAVVGFYRGDPPICPHPDTPGCRAYVLRWRRADRRAVQERHHGRCDRFVPVRVILVVPDPRVHLQDCQRELDGLRREPLAKANQRNDSMEIARVSALISAREGAASRYNEHWALRTSSSAAAHARPLQATHRAKHKVNIRCMAVACRHPHRSGRQSPTDRARSGPLGGLGPLPDRHVEVQHQLLRPDGSQGRHDRQGRPGDDCVAARQASWYSRPAPALASPRSRPTG